MPRHTADRTQAVVTGNPLRVRRYPLQMELAELIFEKRVISGQPEWFADLFGRLMSLTADNGAEIRGTLGRWLDGQDVEKVRIALAFDEGYLWDSTSEMDRRLANVLSRFPGEAQRCKAARDRWISQTQRWNLPA